MGKVCCKVLKAKSTTVSHPLLRWIAELIGTSLFFTKKGP